MCVEWLLTKTKKKHQQFCTLLAIWVLDGLLIFFLKNKNTN